MLSIDTPGAPGSVRDLTPKEFEEIRRLAYEKFGLDLRPGKEELVSARLSRLIRAQNCRTFHEYIEYMQQDRTGESLIALINALTTNHTGFLREPAHFELLRRLTAALGQERDRLSVWSAACSTGEEPYSIAFTMLDEIGFRTRPRVEVLATDISTRVLGIAQNGSYTKESLVNLPPGWQRRFFTEDAAGGLVKVRSEVKSLISFRRLNLVEEFPFRRHFTFIFCRNVMIYFDKPTQTRLVNRLADCLEAGGYLLVGHAECLTTVDHPLEYFKPAVYRKPASGQRRLQTARN
jgi:chemotaxis protein methyltransferase CheR